MIDNSFLLYGAYGYTGELIAREAKIQGLHPILAGRKEEKLQPLAEELGFPYLVFGLEDTLRLHEALEKVPVVLHAAGPFIHTAVPMIEACLETKTHYLDITGEIEVFERAQQLGSAAEQLEIMLMPGVGFDVVPTDCLAKFLLEQLPDATHLQLAFATQGSQFSRGTALTMVENFGEPGAARVDGRIVPVPVGHKTLEVPFTDERKQFCMSIPWGDVSTAYHTTGIPNIETFTGFSRRAFKYVKAQRYFGWLLRQGWVRKIARNRILSGPAGPNEQQLEQGRSLVWGRVTNAEGEQCSARLQTLEGYRLTALTALLIIQRVLQGDAYHGYQTPAGAYGADLILEIQDTHRELILSK